MPTVPLVPLFVALLDNQHQLDERHARGDAVQKGGVQSGRREAPRAIVYRVPARSTGTRGKHLTDQEENEVKCRAALEAETEVARDLDERARREAEERLERGEIPLVRRTPWNQALSHLWPAMTVAAPTTSATQP